MGRPTFQVFKDPSEVLDYVLDWGDEASPWMPLTDTIASATVTVPSGITKDSSTNTATTQTAWLSGGTDGQLYDVVFQIVTTEGRTGERTLRVIVKNR